MRIGKPRDSGSRRNLGSHPIEPGLDRGNRGVAVRGIDECSDGGHYTVFEQRLPDRRGRVTGPDLNHDVSLAGTGVVVTEAQHGLPQLGADDDGHHHHHDEQAQGKSAGDAPSPADLLGVSALSAADSGPAVPVRSYRHRLGAVAVATVRHRSLLESRPSPRDVHPASSAVLPLRPLGRSPHAARRPAPPPAAKIVEH
ncbi:Uncharacterised protein [Mycobacterium tuberculosis]|nr:Uncharacterised protein [Mycobacterium tuberculosis]